MTERAASIEEERCCCGRCPVVAAVAVDDRLHDGQDATEGGVDVVG